MNVEFGNYYDNVTVLMVAQKLLEAESIAEALTLLTELREHIDRSGEIKSKTWLLPTVERIIASEMKKFGRDVKPRSPRKPRRARRGRIAVPSPDRTSNAWERPWFEWALRISFINAIVRFVWHDVAPIMTTAGTLMWHMVVPVVVQLLR